MTAATDGGSAIHYSSSFAYRPLQTSPQEIRLIRLLGAPSYEPIVCNIIHVEFNDENTQYEALSYAWGEHKDRRTISVDGERVSVTRNLAMALQYLRDPIVDTIIWIDALCINQEDKMEKSIQVALMRDIYRHAEHVKMWLGPAANNSDTIMRVFNEEGPRLYAYTDEDTTSRMIYKGVASAFGDEIDRLEEEMERVKAYLIDEGNSRLRRSLEALLKRDYWTRAWVVQEIVMAQKLTILCGLASSPWNHAVAVMALFHQAQQSSLPHGRDPRESKANMSAQTRAISGVVIGTPPILANLRRCDDKWRSTEWLVYALVDLRHFRCTEPRDKIFSLLGLMNAECQEYSRKGEHRVEVDYSLSLVEVSFRLVKFCVFFEDPEIEGSSLNIICASQPEKLESAERFPSWLPEFSRYNGISRMPVLEHQPRCWYSAFAVFSSQPETLSVHSFFVDIVRDGHVTDDEDDTLAVDALGILSRCHKVVETLKKAQGRHKHPGYWLWRALDLWGKTGYGASKCLQTEDRSEKDVEEWFLKPIEHELRHNDSPYVGAFLDDFRTKSYRRRFAIFVVKGICCYAMVPATTRPGDRLYILGDCDYPVILRPRLDLGENAFEFVGPCCVPQSTCERGWIRGSVRLDIPVGSLETVVLY